MKKSKFFKATAFTLLSHGDLNSALDDFIGIASPLINLSAISLEHWNGSAFVELYRAERDKGKKHLCLDMQEKGVKGRLVLRSKGKRSFKKKHKEAFETILPLFASCLFRTVKAREEIAHEGPVKTRNEAPAPLLAERPDELIPLDELNKRYIELVLKHCKGKIHGKDGAAQILDLNGNTLRNRMDKLGVSYRKKNRN